MDKWETSKRIHKLEKDLVETRNYLIQTRDSLIETRKTLIDTHAALYATQRELADLTDYVKGVAGP